MSCDFKNIKIVTFLGAPGAGKGTVASRLKERLGINVVAMGDMLRRQVSAQTDLGLQIKQCIEQGKFVANEVVNPVVQSELSLLAQGTQVILDGYPRTLAQAEYFVGALLDAQSLSQFAILYLDIDHATVEQRLLNRQICASLSCLLVTNSQAKNCSKCGGSVVKRTDDNQEAITRRLKEFYQSCDSLLNFYHQQGCRVLKINMNDLGVEEAYSAVVEQLGHFFNLGDTKL